MPLLVQVMPAVFAPWKDMQDPWPTATLRYQHPTLTIPNHWIYGTLTGQRTGPATWTFQLTLIPWPSMRLSVKEWRQWWSIWVPNYPVESLKRLPDGGLEGARQDMPLPD